MRAGKSPDFLVLRGLARCVAASQRVRAVIVLIAADDVRRLREVLDAAKKDWRGVLVAAGLAGDDWPAWLDSGLGPAVATTVLWRPTGPK